MGGIIQAFFKDMIFIFAGAFFVFLTIEKLLDGSNMSIKEKLKFLYTHPKHFDVEGKKLSFHYKPYIMGSVLLTVSSYGLVYQFLILGSSLGLKDLIILIAIFVWGASEIINELLYKESEINYKHYEKNGRGYMLKLNYQKETMKNSPITLVRDGLFFSIVGLSILIATVASLSIMLKMFFL